MDYTNRFLVKFYIDMHYNMFKCECKIVDNIEKTKKFCAAAVGADGAELGSRSALEERRLLACLHHAWLARRLASGRVSTLLSNCVFSVFTGGRDGNRTPTSRAEGRAPAHWATASPTSPWIREVTAAPPLANRTKRTVHTLQRSVLSKETPRARLPAPWILRFVCQISVINRSCVRRSSVRRENDLREQRIMHATLNPLKAQVTPVGADGAELGSRSALEERRLLACLHHAWLARRLASGRVSTLLSNCVFSVFTGGRDGNRTPTSRAEGRAPAHWATASPTSPWIREVTAAPPLANRTKRTVHTLQRSVLSKETPRARLPAPWILRFVCQISVINRSCVRRSSVRRENDLREQRIMHATLNPLKAQVTPVGADGAELGSRSALEERRLLACLHHAWLARRLASGRVSTLLSNCVFSVFTGGRDGNRTPTSRAEGRAPAHWATASPTSPWIREVTAAPPLANRTKRTVHTLQRSVLSKETPRARLPAPWILRFVCQISVINRSCVRRSSVRRENDLREQRIMHATLNPLKAQVTPVGADGAELGSRSALEERRLLACLHHAWLARRLASGRVSTLLSNCVFSVFTGGRDGNRTPTSRAEGRAPAHWATASPTSPWIREVTAAPPLANRTKRTVHTLQRSVLSKETPRARLPAPWILRFVCQISVSRFIFMPSLSSVTLIM
ncbi:unnamed protein product [Trichogramma brassicae]|uniref:Uncharacterized protein n=1 Tax=Trichogramma brassicae TaxID=86971 RepID=A0A6H5HVH6_9HYME|nr:unnamed protein product [Trichogramma brassicae]